MHEIPLRSRVELNIRVALMVNRIVNTAAAVGAQIGTGSHVITITTIVIAIIIVITVKEARVHQKAEL